MKAGDLIKKLEELDPDMEIYFMDSCGCCSSYEPVEGVSVDEHYVYADEENPSGMRDIAVVGY